MTLLVVGATGTLGQALLRQARFRSMPAIGAARSGTAHAIDLGDPVSVRRTLNDVRPDLVVNAAAITDVDACARDPETAFIVNARGAGVLAAESRNAGARFVQISTDHFFTGDGDRLHDEEAPVCLVNDYARSKFAGEALASAQSGALVIRTNFTGWRGWSRPNFIEWATGEIRAGRRIDAFADFFTSTIDADALARAVLDLADKDVRGVVNVGSSQTCSKATFLRRLAAKLGRERTPIVDASVRTLAVPRGDSLGLDVTKAEGLLGWRLPGLDEVIDALLVGQRETACAS